MLNYDELAIFGKQITNASQNGCVNAVWLSSYLSKYQSLWKSAERMCLCTAPKYVQRIKCLHQCVGGVYSSRRSNEDAISVDVDRNHLTRQDDTEDLVNSAVEYWDSSVAKCVSTDRYSSCCLYAYRCEIIHPLYWNSYNNDSVMSCNIIC